MSDAGRVLDADPALLAQVAQGAIALSAAVDVIVERAEEEAEEARRFTEVQRDAPDFLEAIAEGRMTLGEAWGATRERTRKAREDREKRVAATRQSMARLPLLTEPRESLAHRRQVGAGRDRTRSEGAD